jgi:hypothetical protein
LHLFETALGRNDITGSGGTGRPAGTGWKLTVSRPKQILVCGESQAVARRGSPADGRAARAVFAVVRTTETHPSLDLALVERRESS